jgi:glutathione S-transferase
MRVLSARDWLTDQFLVVDTLMVDLFRVIDRFDGLIDTPTSRSYTTRVTDRPALQKVYADLMGISAKAERVPVQAPSGAESAVRPSDTRTSRGAGCRQTV